MEPIHLAGSASTAAADGPLAFPEGDALAPPFALPRSDWIAINDRVAVTIKAQAHHEEIQLFIPNYPELLAVCLRWASRTFPAVLEQAVATNLFATQAAEVLTGLASSLAGAAAGEPVPSKTAFIVDVRLKALAQNAGRAADAAVALGQEIAAFIAANRAADAAWRHPPQPPLFPEQEIVRDMIAGLLGWLQLATGIAPLEVAMSDIGSSWATIVDQLKALSGDQVQITTAGLLAGNLQTATRSWAELAATAAAFDSMASTLTSAGGHATA